MSSARAENRETHETAAEPWLARPDWATGRVNPSGGSWTMIIVIALVWNALCVAIGYFVYPQLRAQFAAGEYLILLLLIFPLIGVGLAINAVRSVIHRRRSAGCGSSSKPFLRRLVSFLAASFIPTRTWI